MLMKVLEADEARIEEIDLFKAPAPSIYIYIYIYIYTHTHIHTYHM